MCTGPYFSENVEEAQALLAEAGYPGGAGFPEISYELAAERSMRISPGNLQPCGSREIWASPAASRLRIPPPLSPQGAGLFML